MTIRVASEFAGRQGGWECFFATTYSFELELFDEYLFRRLGEAPLNATVLCDFDQLARRLDAINPDESRLLQRANRDYLLRGVHLGGAFHPKTYFFAGKKRGVLLVGSGNLSLRGIEQGREVFCRFDSQVEEDLPTMRGWRDWINRLVGRVDDRQVSHRWLDLKDRALDWLPGPADRSLFVSNDEQSILDTLESRIAAPVDELHVLAPFYDRDATALAATIKRLSPHRVCMYLGSGTNVHGPSLATVLERCGAEVDLRVYEPAEFIHAKLIGMVTDERGWLLSGSANLSRAALMSTVGMEAYANVEAGVLVQAPADVVRGAFHPSGLELHQAALDVIRGLEYSSDEPIIGLPLRLLSAQVDPRRQIAVTYAGEMPGELFLTAGLDSQPLSRDKMARQLTLPEGGALVWLCDSLGARTSNKMVLDDPAKLRGWLEERQRGGELPAGVDPIDADTPVGQLLLWLNSQCIFDIDDTRAAARARRLANEEREDSDSDWSFIDELAREELRLDPRVDRYRHPGTGLPLDDEVFILLDLMLQKTPVAHDLHLVPGALAAHQEGEPKAGTPWTLPRRIELRVFNVLSRWCSALSDPRFIWIGRTAPVRNYAALLAGLATCWEAALLPEDRITLLLETLLGSFVAADRTPGYLSGLAEDDRHERLEHLPREARVLAASLLYCVLREAAAWKEWVFRLQPAMEPALDLGVLEFGAEVPAIVKRLVGETVTPMEVEERLLAMTAYLDDPHWCLKQQRELGLGRVTLTHQGFNRRFGITLSVEGATLENARLVSLIRQALSYRHVEGVVVEVGADRVSVYIGDPIRARINSMTFESSESFDAERLADLDRRGIGLDHVLQFNGAMAG